MYVRVCVCMFEERRNDCKHTWMDAWNGMEWYGMKRMHE